MAKEKFERTKPHVNIGTIGHKSMQIDSDFTKVLAEKAKNIIRKKENAAPSTLLRMKPPRDIMLTLRSRLCQRTITGAAQMDGAHPSLLS